VQRGLMEFVSAPGSAAGIGRAFTESEDRPGNTVVMLTWSVFRRRFAGDAKIVGRQIHLDGRPFTVVGVLPSWFTYPMPASCCGFRIKRMPRRSSCSITTGIRARW